MMRRERGEPVGDLGVALVGGVLIAHGGSGGAVTGPAHDLGKRRACLGRQGEAGVA